MKMVIPLWLVVIFSLQGCATAPVEHSLKDEYAGSVRNAQVYVLLPQKQLYALFPEFNATTGTSVIESLIGGLINSYENSKGYKVMQENVAPVVAVTSDMKWGADLTDALQQSNIFTSSQAVSLVDSDSDEEERVAELVNSATKPWVVIVKGEYYLDAWYRVLTIGANVALYKQGEAEPAHTFRSVYYSKPITAELELTITGKHAKLWAANDGLALRTYEAEGGKAIAALIKTALLERPSNVPSEGDTVQEYIDWDSMRYSPRSAKLVSDDDNSFMLVDGDGRFISSPKIDTYASAKESQRALGQGKARVYVYQEEGIIGFSPELYDNGKSVGAIYPNSYFSFDIQPGEHSFSLRFNGDILGASIARSQYEDVQPVTITAKAGERYSLFFKGYKGFFTPDDALMLKPLAESEGRMVSLEMSY